MTGLRKFWIVIIGLGVELTGLGFMLFWKADAGLFVTFSGAVVALCGLFFGYNAKEHKANGHG